jgi:hypothetical protein
LNDTNALYEPLIERDLAAIPAAARAFAQQHSVDALWIAVARFAVLAYAPSQHAKRAVLACRAAHHLREELGERWLDMIIECARYASASRLPWSEPPILDPPASDDGAIPDLRAIIDANDRFAAERWLAANLASAHDELRKFAKGDAVLMLDAAIALEAQLGEKGRYALLRMVLLELLTPTDDPTEPLEVLIDHAIEAKGSIESVRDVLIAAARKRPGESPQTTDNRQPTTANTNGLRPYVLAGDYAQTLLTHAIARTLPVRVAELLAAVHHNLEHGESFAEWSFA